MVEAANLKDSAPFIPASHADASEMLATAETFIAKMKEIVKGHDH